CLIQIGDFDLLLTAGGGMGLCEDDGAQEVSHHVVVAGQNRKPGERRSEECFAKYPQVDMATEEFVDFGRERGDRRLQYFAQAHLAYCGQLHGAKKYRAGGGAYDFWIGEGIFLRACTHVFPS